MAKMLAFHNLVHGEPMTVLEGNDDMLVLQRGEKGILVMNKSSRPQSLKLSVTNTLVDMMTGEDVPCGEEIKVAAKSAMLLVER